MSPNLQTDFDRRIEKKQQWKETKANPAIVIKNHKEWIETRDNYNRYGVFSTSKDELNNEIWEKYGDQHSGYCLGFKTADLCRQMKSGYGFVTYSDKLYQYSFLDKKDDELDPFCLKKLSWEYEKEFRFITVEIGVYG